MVTRSISYSEAKDAGNIVTLETPHKDGKGRIYREAYVSGDPINPGWHIFAKADGVSATVITRLRSRVEHPRAKAPMRNARVPLGWKTKKDASFILKTLAMKEGEGFDLPQETESSITSKFNVERIEHEQLKKGDRVFMRFYPDGWNFGSLSTLEYSEHGLGFSDNYSVSATHLADLILIEKR